MIGLERILCPTDLSEDSERTLRYAVALALSSEAKLFVCHLPKSSANEEDALLTIQTLIAAGQAFLADADTKGGTLEWESILLKNPDLGTAITQEAELRRAGLIIMRSRRRPFAAALLGSTAEAVSRVAPCPVLVMHADEREWLDNSTRAILLKRVLVAYDFSQHSALALQYGLTLAQQYQSELHILHVLPPPVSEQPEVAWVGQDTDTPYHLAARRLQDAVPGEVHLWSNVVHAVQFGQPHSEILNYAEKHQIDLISMGAHGLGFGIQTLFGSNVDRVLRQAGCPVLIAHPIKSKDQDVESADS
jgi:nucleotide-binding universal stress UspA family protein